MPGLPQGSPANRSGCKALLQPLGFLIRTRLRQRGQTGFILLFDVLRRLTCSASSFQRRRFPQANGGETAERFLRAGPCLWEYLRIDQRACSNCSALTKEKGKWEFTPAAATSVHEAVAMVASSPCWSPALAIRRARTSRQGGSVFRGTRDIERMSRRCCQGPWRQ